MQFQPTMASARTQGGVCERGDAQAHTYIHTGTHVNTHTHTHSHTRAHTHLLHTRAHRETYGWAHRHTHRSAHTHTALQICIHYTHILTQLNKVSALAKQINSLSLSLPSV